MSMKKEKTAHLFPNAIVISTADKRVRPCANDAAISYSHTTMLPFSIPQYGFSTFANRNKSYDILQMVWQNETSDLVSSN